MQQKRKEERKDISDYLGLTSSDSINIVSNNIIRADPKTPYNKLLTSSDAQNIVFGLAHTAFISKDCTNNVIFYSEAGRPDLFYNKTYFDKQHKQKEGHNIIKTFTKEDDEQIHELFSKNTTVSIGRQISSGSGSCYKTAYMMSRFLTKNNYQYRQSLEKYVLNKIQQIDQTNNKDDSNVIAKYQPESSKKDNNPSSARRTNGFFDIFIQKGDKQYVIDLLEWEYVVDLIKDVQSLQFIENFSKRYENNLLKTPTIGQLKLPLKDYVDFFSTDGTEYNYFDKDGKILQPQNRTKKTKKFSRCLDAHCYLMLLHEGKLTEDDKQNVNNILEEGDIAGDETYMLYNKEYNFDDLLNRIIENNNLLLTIDELKDILEQKFSAKKNYEKMFVLAERSDELKQEIEKKEWLNSNVDCCERIGNWLCCNGDATAKKDRKRKILLNKVAEYSNSFGKNTVLLRELK